MRENEETTCWSDPSQHSAGTTQSEHNSRGSSSTAELEIQPGSFDQQRQSRQLFPPTDQRITPGLIASLNVQQGETSHGGYVVRAGFRTGEQGNANLEA